jgi:aquaporin Z
MGKVASWDAFFFVLFQFIGGSAGVALVALFAGSYLMHPNVNYAPTLPGKGGEGMAFVAEALISFILFLVVLSVSNQQRIARYTGLVAGLFVAVFIIFESPISGMSMNPARTFASALIPGKWNSIWIYFLAPPLGMAAASIVYKNFKPSIACAKYYHQNNKRCIFCEYQQNKS